MEASTSPPSSPLSSICSVSPTPPSSYISPQDYPSPSSINLSGDGSSTPTRNAPACDNDGPPPAKKRKTMPPKERKTEHLDLRNFGMSDNTSYNKEQELQLNRLTKALRGKRKIVVIAGAGISVSAGIPDFRSSTGLFTTLRADHKLKASGKHLFDASVYKNDDSTSSFHDMVRELSHLTQKAEPTAFHHMLATLAEEGRLLRLYSQNIDGIDTRLPPLATQIPLGRKGPWPKTIQLHGGLEKMVCTKCGHLSAFDGTLFEGSETPSCPECEGIDGARIVAGLRGHGVGRLRPRMVLYNEFNPDDEAIGAVSHADLKSRPDAVIVVGTSLKVPGVRRIVKEMCSVTRGRRDGFTAWINNDPEPLGIDLKDSWDLVVRGTSDEVARHVGLPKWNEDVGEYQMLVSDEEKARVPKDNLLGVVVESKQMSAVKSEGGFLTPTASPRQQSPTPWMGLGKMKQPKLFQDAKSASAKSSSTKSTSAKASIVKKEKKVPTKPRKKPTATDPKNKITSTFNTTKASKATTTKASKSPVVEVPSHLPCRFPGLEKQQISTPMRPISPNLHRNSSNSSIKDEVDTPGNSSFVTCPEDPVTPTMSEKSQYDRSVTISPPSKPSNMTNLID